MTDDNRCAQQQDGKHVKRCTNPHCPGRHCAGGEHRDRPRQSLAEFVGQNTDARVQTRG